MSLKERRALRKAKDKAAKLDWTLGARAAKVGPTVAAKEFSDTVPRARYWAKKVLFPLWHVAGLGGVRRGFSAQKTSEVATAIAQSVSSDPTRTIAGIVREVFLLTLHLVSMTYVKTILAVLDITYVSILCRKPSNLKLIPYFLGCRWKVPETKQRNKYTDANMAYYATFLSWLHMTDPGKLKFIDESHFSTKGTSPLFFSSPTRAIYI